MASTNSAKANLFCKEYATVFYSPVTSIPTQDRSVRALRAPVMPPEAPFYVLRATSGGICHVRVYATTEVCQQGGPARSVPLPPPHRLNLRPFNNTNQLCRPPLVLQPSLHPSPPLQLVRLFRQFHPHLPPQYGSFRSILQV